MPSALVCLKASTRMAVWDWMMARSEIWIQRECQVNILLLSAATIIHSRIAARKETWKPFPSLFSVLISRSLARILSITIAHLSSFVSPLVSPFNPFSFPPQFPLQLLSFQPDLSISPNLYSTPLSVFSPALWQALSHFLHLSVIFLPFLSTFRSFFSLWLLPFPDFFLFYWHILSASLSFFFNTHSLSLCQMHSLPPFLAKPSTDQLSSAAWCLFQCYTLGPTGQFKWFRGGYRHTRTPKMDLIMWPWNMSEFLKCV